MALALLSAGTSQVTQANNPAFADKLSAAGVSFIYSHNTRELTLFSKADGKSNLQMVCKLIGNDPEVSGIFIHLPTQQKKAPVSCD